MSWFADRSAVEGRRAFAGSWLAFVLAVALALPQPPRLDALAWAVAAGALLVGAGFWFTSRCRPLPPAGSAARASRFAAALAAGAALGFGLLGLLAILAQATPELRARFADRQGEPAWRPWALAFESSILEEVVFRLFVLALVAWIATRLGARPPAAFGVGLAVSTLLFGAVHLPEWLALVPPGAGLIATVLALNGVAALVFGWFFWRRGLPAAILCHFAADLVVQTFGPRWLG